LFANFQDKTRQFIAIAYISCHPLPGRESPGINYLVIHAIRSILYQKIMLTGFLYVWQTAIPEKNKLKGM
jgi:hypothetical protein